VCWVMDEQMRTAALEALSALRKRFKTYEAAASELGITRQALSDWRKKGRVSVARVREVSRLTGIPRERLRPDVYGADDKCVAA
jgi:hypothetical protein